MLREALESDLVILKRVYQRLQAKQHRNILCVRIRPITTQSYNALTVSLIPLIPLWTFLSRRYVMSNQRKAERFRVLFNFACHSYTAVSRKVVGKGARNNPERYCGWFWVHYSSMIFERMTREAMDVCLLVLKESNKTISSTATVSGTVYWSYPILPFGIVACTFFSDNLSRNSSTCPFHRL